jgi:hypothetical protein
MIVQEYYPEMDLGNAYGVIDQGKPKTWYLVCFPKARQMSMYAVKSSNILTFMASSRNTTWVALSFFRLRTFSRA